jgi:GR25 family glycosyltransferase involved in LPS biosynthesis
MLTNTYILHIDDPRSLKYLDDCIASCKQFPGINPIPVMGYKEADYKDLCEEYGLSMIPYYLNQMPTMGHIHNRAFSCTAGHIKIWKMIVESNEPGVVLEHDAIVKGPFSNIDVDDDEILWLGPRIEFEDDYRYPWGAIPDYVDVDRWEGTHAYAITPKTAQFLIDKIQEYGLNDSIDGQLGMRNMFDMNFVTVNPPPVVAVVGNRESCIESSGNPGFWNAYHSDQFLKNLRPGCKVPPIRQLHYTDQSFNTLVPALEQVLRGADKLDGREQSVLVSGGYEGLSSVWLSNKLLQHDDGYMHIISNFKDNEEQICRFNTYFSKYYYKLNIIPVSPGNKILEQAAQDPDIRFDVIFSDDNNTQDGILLWNLLKNDGILIFNGGNNTAIESIIDAVNATVLYNNEFSAIKKI